MLGNNHIYFLPYLMGERSPHNDPLARATFTGMTMDSTRTDMTQAVLEGVAFAIRDSLRLPGRLELTSQKPRCAVVVLRVSFGVQLWLMCWELKYIC